MSFIEDYYAAYREDERLLSRHGQVEYLTTMHYIESFAPKVCRILEIGAGTGRYSVALAQKGYQVTAVELVQSNLDQLLQKKPRYVPDCHAGKRSGAVVTFPRQL